MRETIATSSRHQGNVFKRYPSAFFILFLLLQNMLIFSGHYFADSSFPADFGASHFAIPYYWITSVQHGVFPQWVAQEGMGYPLQIDLQSGFFYPFFWLFVVLGKQYTLHAAVMFQCLHVLLGAVGMYFFSRAQALETKYCWVAAVAYQFFGGFYCGAQHADMIRSFTIIPWLLSGLTYAIKPQEGVKAAVFIPLAVYFLCTGGYTGTLMASLFISGCFLVFQIPFNSENNLGDRIICAVKGFFLIAIGLLLSSIQLLPVWMNQNELVRAHDFSMDAKDVMGLENVFTLFLSSNVTDVFHQDPSERSLYITLPIFSMLFFVPPSALKKNITYVLLLIIAGLMLTGSPLYSFLVSFAKPLGYSRFPAIDYQPFIAIFLMIFGVMGLKNFLENAKSQWLNLCRIIVLTVIVVAGIFFVKVYSYPIKALWVEMSAVVVSLVVIIFFVIKKNSKNFNQSFAFIFFVSVLFFNGACVIGLNYMTWIQTNVYSLYQNGAHLSLKKDLTTLSPNLTASLSYRPERVGAETHENFTWLGYLTGQFMMKDYGGGAQMARFQKIYDGSKVVDPVLFHFMKKRSQAILLPANAPINKDILYRAILLGTPSPLVGEEPVERVTLTNAQPKVDDKEQVMILKFSSNELDYQVRTSSPQIMVENEMYFPGWTATLHFPDQTTHQIAAFPVAGALRAWLLPAGNYLLITTFQMPYLFEGAMISMVTLFLWLGLLFGLRHRNL